MAKVTIYDIARLAGVSASTVSRVVNQSERVDPQTRERILAVIKEQGFTPSIHASGLKGRNHLIGLLLPALTWTAILDVIWSVATRVSSYHSYGILLYTCLNEQEYQQAISQILETKIVAGLVTMVYTQSPEYLVSFYQDGFPVVLIDTVDTPADLPRVSVDQRGGAYQAVRYLLSLGHHRIGYIHGATVYPCSLERYQGYCDALHEEGLVPDPTLFQQGEFDPPSGYRCAEALLSLPDKPTAIFASNDAMAYAVINYADEHGIRVPEDLAVAGFNDDPQIDGQHATLTTVHQPYADIGRCAIEMLLSQIDPHVQLSEDWLRFRVPSTSSDAGEHPHSQPLQIRLPANLVIRGSSGLPM